MEKNNSTKAQEANTASATLNNEFLSNAPPPYTVNQVKKIKNFKKNLIQKYFLIQNVTATATQSVQVASSQVINQNQVKL